MIEKLVKGLLKIRHILTGIVIIALLLYMEYNGLKIQLPTIYLTCTQYNTTVDLKLFLSNIVINCATGTATLQVPQILLNCLLVTMLVLVTVWEIARRKLRSIVMSYISGILLVAALLTIVPLPEGIHTSTVQGLVPVIDPPLAVLLYGLAAGAILLGVLVEEPREVTEVYVSVDELMEPTLPLEERKESEAESPQSEHP